MRDGAKLTVGYDGSEGALRALRWAVQAAAGHGATVSVVACYAPLATTDPWLGAAPIDVARVGADASRMVQWAAERVASCGADVRIHHRAVLGAAGNALVEAASGSDLLVLGRSGHRAPVDAWRLGSVAHGALRHAPCPVVVVPDAQPSPPLGRVVVGVDTSPAASAAVLWAADEADSRDATLVVVHVWSYPYATELASPSARDLMRVDAALVLETAVRQARERCRVDVEPILVEGVAHDELVACSEHADLVVVGSRGHGALRAALLGSVAHSVAAHAAAPVVVVHPPR